MELIQICCGIDGDILWNGYTCFVELDKDMFVEIYQEDLEQWKVKTFVH